MEYISEILKELEEGKISADNAEQNIAELHEQKMKNFMSEVIQVTRYNLMEAEKNLTPLIEKYKL